MTVYTKLLEAQKAVTGVAKAGRNEAQKYDFVRAVDVVKEGKRLLNDVGLLVYLDVYTRQSTVIPRGDKPPAILFEVDGMMTVVDPDDGSTMQIQLTGAGSSYADEKGVYKAITGLWKYGFRILLQIPDEKDDPEVETENDREQAAPARVVAPAGPKLATDAQKRMIRGKAKDAGLTEDANFKTFFFAVTGKRSSKELTHADVEALLAKLEDPAFVSEYTTEAMVAAS